MMLSSNLSCDISSKSYSQLILDAASLEIIQANATATKLYGYCDNELSGKNIHQICPQFVTGLDCKTRHKKQDNKSFYAMTSCFEMQQDETALLLVTIKPLAESLTSDQDSLSTLISGFAHELNTPTGNAIMAASSMGLFINNIRQALNNKTLTSQGLNALLNCLDEAQQHVQSATCRISELVEQVKRIAVSWVMESIVSFNVREYAQNVFKQFAQRLTEKNITAHLNCPEELIISHDAVAFIQILEQLMENSYLHAFNQQQSGNIYLDIRQQQEQMVIDYRDDGCGISQESNARVFDLFYTSGRAQGLVGLGMNMVFNIVLQRFNGEISCIPDDNGARFHITFPLLKDQSEVFSDDNITEF